MVRTYVPLLQWIARVSVSPSKRQQFVLEDRDPTGLALHLDALTGQLVQGLPLMLDRREHRRHLLDLAAELLERRLDALGGHALDRTGLDHLTVGVAAVGGDAELNPNPIALVRGQQVLRELRGFAEAQRQHAGGQRIQRAGVTDLAGIEQPLRPLHRIVRRHAGGLVQNQNTVHVPAATTLSHGADPRRWLCR
jgi:hypothetical protein